VNAAAIQSLPHRLAVVADDLTGAADASAPFADRGADVGVAFAWPARADLDVLALVTDSRWRDESDAALRVGQMVLRARTWGAGQLFVKVDSTLRGNVRAEVSAALAAWPSTQVVATPAFPAQGRIVRDGVLYIHGQRQTGVVADAFPAGIRVLDAETDEQLDEIAQNALSNNSVTVGSAGLARALAAALLPKASARHPKGPVNGVLVVVGTPHPTSRSQAHAFVDAGAVRIVVRPPSHPPIDEGIAELLRGGRVLLTTDDDDDVSPQATKLVTPLAQAVREITTATPDTAIVLTGGATALAVSKTLGAREFRLLSEISPGIAIGELVLADRAIPTITKSGGFGAAETLLQAAATLEACR
jgi:uncharacterized protein YgbK (DUF1537 family)